MTNSTAIEGRRRRASISTWGRGLPPAKIRYNGRRVFKGWATYPYPQAVLGPATNLVPGSPCVIVIPTRICSLRGLQTFATSHTPWTKAQNRARYRFDTAVCNCCAAHTGCPTAGRSSLLKQTHAPDLGRYNDITAFVPLALLNAKGVETACKEQQCPLLCGTPANTCFADHKLCSRESTRERTAQGRRGGDSSSFSRFSRITHFRDAPAESFPSFPTVNPEGGFGGAKEAHILLPRISLKTAGKAGKWRIPCPLNPEPLPFFPQAQQDGRCLDP